MRPLLSLLDTPRHYVLPSLGCLHAYAFAFNLCYPWVAWYRSELNSWSLLCSTNLQRDLRASILERLSWPIVSNVEGPNSFNCLHGRDPNNCLQVKETASYLFNCLHKEGPINCLQVKGSHFVFHVLSWFICSYFYVWDGSCIFSVCWFQTFMFAWYAFMDITYKHVYYSHIPAEVSIV